MKLSNVTLIPLVAFSILIMTCQSFALSSAGVSLGTCSGTADGCYRIFRRQCDDMNGQLYVTGGTESFEGYCNVNSRSSAYAVKALMAGISIECKRIVASAILKKYPSIRSSGGRIRLDDINPSYDPNILEVSFASKLECSAGVEVKVQQSSGGTCDVQQISEMYEQC